MAPTGEPETLHRFKNCLTLSLSYCDLLLDELPPESPAVADILEIQKALRQALQSLPEVLALAAEVETR